MNDVITLISRSGASVDDAGDRIFTESSRDVFCAVMSIGEKEFYQGHAAGLQPEIKFLLADYYDYEGEEIVEFDGVRYKVLRTYRKDNELEITCTRELNNFVAPSEEVSQNGTS